MLQGKADTDIAKISGTHSKTVGEHRKKCIPATLAKARHMNDVRRADWLIEESQHLYSKARAVIDKAEAEETAEIKRIARGMKAADRDKVNKIAEAMAGSRAEVLNAIRTAKPVLELLAKLAGQLQEQVTVNFASSPQYAELRKVILEAIKPHNDAWLDLSDALNEFQERNGIDDASMH